MSHLTETTLLATSTVTVAHVTCCSPRGPLAGEEHNRVAQIVLPRRGLFVVHRSRHEAIADPTTALVFAPDESYRISHPLDGGDECLVLTFAAEVHEEALRSLRGCATSVAPRTQRGIYLFAGALAREGTDELASEEAALLLFAALADELRAAHATQRGVSTIQRDRAAAVRTLLAADPARRWRIDAIARSVHCSPFHLARDHRRATGETIARYLLRLRMAAALDRLAQGERDLGRLACELGFSHHSHFTARFRSVFGCTPTAARAASSAASLHEMRTILTADLDPPP